MLEPGQSWWIDTREMVRTFIAGDLKYPQSKDIFAKLQDLSVKMKEEGYAPDLECVLRK